MDRQAEIVDLRRTIAAQKAWGKFSVRNHNGLAQLEAEERVERWGFDWLSAGTWLLALAYCAAFWWGVGAGIWRFAEPLIRGMLGHG